MRKVSLLFLVLLTACAGKPRTQPPQPWYVTAPHLDAKAKAYRNASMELTNNSGLLLYSGFLPFTNADNYVDSHNVADAPAWHGALMIAMGLKMASEPDPQDLADLDKLADGLLKYYEITGKPGLFGRSYLNDHTAQRLPWMETKEQRPTKYWMQGNGGRWWRNGLAKGHFTFAVLGCGIPLMLHERGDIQLPFQIRAKLLAFMLPAVQRLVDGGFRYRDFDGGFTEFGDLRPDVAFGPDWPQISGVPNGFNRVVVLAALAACRKYDAALARLYEDKAIAWGPGIGASMELVGEFVIRAGHARLGKPSFSDMQLYGVASFAVMLQEDRREVRHYIHRGMRGLWEYMRYERNPMFTLPYALARRNEAASRVQEIIEDLRAFPLPKDKIAREFVKKDTDKVQPLANRTSNTHYWKSSPFRRVISAGPPITHPKTSAVNVYSGQDYLLAYWMGRFLKLIPAR